MTKVDSPEVEEWCFHLMNDPEYFEKWMYTDNINAYNINAYNSIIEKCQKTI